MFTQLLLAIGAISTVSARPTVRSEYQVKETHYVPLSWTNVGPADKKESIHLQLGLKQQSEGAVEQHLLEVSDPKHARYGQHLSTEEIHEMIKPTDETLELVQAWLAEHDITTVAHAPSKDWIHVVVPIEKAEELLQTTYSKFQHWDGSVLSRTPEWSLPAHLHEHIDVVQPTTSFFNPKGQVFSPLLDDNTQTLAEWDETNTVEHALSAADASIAKVCNESNTTPKCIRTLYGTIDYEPQVPGQNRIGFCNYLNQTAKRSDVRQFLRRFRPEATAAADEYDIVIINNGDDDQGPYTQAQIDAAKNVEGNLDAQQMISVVWPTPVTAYNTGGMPPINFDRFTQMNTNEPYLTFLNYILAQDSVPQVITTSYGDDEQTAPRSYAKRVCSGYAQLGAKGVSVLFSSGDYGVGAVGYCVSNKPPHQKTFLATFPASCPWVTTVGGTKNFQPEVAVTRFASGGGFSNYFDAPAYQKATVSAYVKSLGGIYPGLYNKQGRGYPDVAAQGDHDSLVWAGNVSTVGGTSASCPTFGGVISLVNDALLAKGKPALGFLNPWIYGGAYKALTDVLEGSSYGCHTSGFPAQAGWDAVTGFGTPNFGKLVDAALAAQKK